MSELVEYTQAHFGYGEKVMLKKIFPGFGAHKPNHENLIDMVGKFAAD